MAIDTPQNRMYGRFDHTMDDKGRITVPQRFRDSLGEEFVLTMGPSHCVRAYPIKVWEQVEAAYASRSARDEYDSTSQLLQRMIGTCDFVSMDAQNRVTIPRFLKEWAGLSDRDYSAVLGTGSHIEFWKIATLEDLQKACTSEAIDAANASRPTQYAAANQNPSGADNSFPGAPSDPASE